MDTKRKVIWGISKSTVHSSYTLTREILHAKIHHAVNRITTDTLQQVFSSVIRSVYLSREHDDNLWIYKMNSYWAYDHVFGATRDENNDYR
jgi:hypothetical protein